MFALTWNEELKLPDWSYLYQIFKVVLSCFTKYQRVTDNPPIRIYVNQIENRITFKIRTRYYPELLTSETRNGSTKQKITKMKKVKKSLI